MKILIVNPNTTVEMTVAIAAAARDVAASGTEIIAATSRSGPPSIEGFYDEALSVPGLLAEIALGEQAGVDGHVIACFDDTGLEAARSFARAPVIGIGESAFHLASLVARRFSVVTTLSRSIAAIENNLLRYGLERRCAKVRACEVPVLSLEGEGSNARTKIEVEISKAVAEDGADAIVLGCAGMAKMAQSLSAAHGVPIIDGVGCAVVLAEGLARLGLSTSKRGAYAPPGPKAYSGVFATLTPAGSRA